MAQGLDASIRQVSVFFKPSLSNKVYRFKSHDAGKAIKQVIELSPTKLLLGTTLPESDYQYGVSYYTPNGSIPAGSNWTLVRLP